MVVTRLIISFFHSQSLLCYFTISNGLLPRLNYTTQNSVIAIFGALVAWCSLKGIEENGNQYGFSFEFQSREITPLWTKLARTWTVRVYYGFLL